MNKEQLASTAQAIIANNKGILAADESTATIAKRFASINLESTEQRRRDYREMLFRAENAGEYIGGAILFDETLRQSAADGTSLVQVMNDAGTIPGIKVDKGAKALAGRPGETITEGLDGLRERLAEYYDLGARFAKWRGVIDISNDIPSHYAVRANADALARYAALCQEARIVPIVEPEILMDGDHDIDRCEEVTQHVLETVFQTLYEANVYLEGILLKPNMVISGKGCANQASANEVAERTVTLLKRVVPSAVPGIVFLSGGQTEQQATEHLDLMNKGGNLPWAVSYSYGRALQQSALQTWKGNESNVAAAQEAYLHRAKCNSLAAAGKYDVSMG